MLCTQFLMSLTGGFPAVVLNGTWHPGIGDPTVWGWSIVVGYFLSSSLCLWNAVLEGSAGSRRKALFWRVLAVLLFCLGVNKQFDLLSWFWVTGRQLARDQGWYMQRRGVQEWIMGLSGAGAVVIGSICCWRVRSAPRGYMFAILGVAFLLCFVLARALSFHYLDQVLGLQIAGFSVNRTLECAGIVLVCVSAWRAGRAAKAGRR